MEMGAKKDITSLFSTFSPRVLFLFRKSPIFEKLDIKKGGEATFLKMKIAEIAITKTRTAKIGHFPDPRW